MAYCSCFRSNTNAKSKSKINGDQVLPMTRDPDGSGRMSNTHSSYFEKDLVRQFGWEEIERLTKKFSWVIGEGGFSTVYLGCFLDSTLGALKIYRRSERLNRVFKQELEILMQVRHENIVKLLGYCDEGEESVLVLEYISNGTLHDLLHNMGPTSQPLLWAHRMSITFQLAQAIQYLHESCNLQIVHGDVKSSNLLVDQHFNCKLCDFGSSKMGFSSTVLPSPAGPVMGSLGYVDPHHLRTGIASKKSDVYSFGVLILELITGAEAFSEGKLLTNVVGPMLKEPGMVVGMVDPRLAGEFDAKEVEVMGEISAACLRQQPSLRPSMAEILRIMEERISTLNFAGGKSWENCKSVM